MNTVWRSQTHLDDSSWEKNLCELCADVMLCAIWCYLYNLQNVKNTHGLVLILVKLQAEAKPFLSLYIFVGKISRFLRFCSLLTDFSFFNKSSKEKFGSFLLTNLESHFFFAILLILLFIVLLWDIKTRRQLENRDATKLFMRIDSSCSRNYTLFTRKNQN